MKNKILVEIRIPHLDETYNIYLPLNKNVANVIVLIAKAIREMKNNDNINFDNCKLYNYDTGLAFPPNTIIRESIIRNGSILILL